MMIRRVLIATVLMLAVPMAASAFTISADLDTGNCFSTDLDDCVGGLYSLEVASTGASRFQATITANYSGLYDLDLTLGNAYATHVEIKVANNYLGPLSASGGTPQDGPLSGGGCNGNNSGFICVELDAPELIVDSMSWTIDFGTDSLLAATDQHLGMRFVWPNPGNGKQNKALLSASAIPEPTAALLFAVGMGVAHGGVRRRR